MDGVTTVTDRGVPPDSLSALDILNAIDGIVIAGIVDGTHPEGDCPLCTALDDLRDVLTEKRSAPHGRQPMSEPTTDLDALWDALWDELRHYATGRPSGHAIITRHRPAIEAEARASQPLTLDVERLARAWRRHQDGTDHAGCAVHCSAAIAAEYERLGKP